MSSTIEDAAETRLEAQGAKEHHRLVAGGVVIFVLALMAYWPALRGQFVWDDVMLVQQNPLVTGKFGLGSIWFRTDFPLANIAFWAQWRLWGDHPAGYHVVNVLLHAASSVLLWRVVARLGIRGGWLAGLVFAVHPVCAASVAWVAELKNTLSLPFYLLGILCWLSFESSRDEGERGRALGWYLLSLGAFLLALLSKTSTVMLPVVLLGRGWWQREPRSRPAPVPGAPPHQRLQRPRCLLKPQPREWASLRSTSRRGRRRSGPRPSRVAASCASPPPNSPTMSI